MERRIQLLVAKGFSVKEIAEILDVPAEEITELDSKKLKTDKKALVSKVEVFMDFPSAFCCPISRELMDDPVVASDGHTYDRKNIKSWFESCRMKNAPLTSPLTKAEMGEHLVANLDKRRDFSDFMKRFIDEVFFYIPLLQKAELFEELRLVLERASLFCSRLQYGDTHVKILRELISFYRSRNEPLIAKEHIRALLLLYSKKDCQEEFFKLYCELDEPRFQYLTTIPLAFLNIVFQNSVKSKQDKQASRLAVDIVKIIPNKLKDCEDLLKEAITLDTNNEEAELEWIYLQQRKGDSSKAVSAIIDKSFKHGFSDTGFLKTQMITLIDFLRTDYMRLALSQKNFVKSKLNYYNFSRLNWMEGLDFTDAQLEGANFFQSNLKKCTFNKANLRNASFENCELEDCGFGEAVMTSVAISGAIVRGCSFVKVNLQSANLGNTNLFSCNFTEANMDNIALQHTTAYKCTFVGVLGSNVHEMIAKIAETSETVTHTAVVKKFTGWTTNNMLSVTNTSHTPTPNNILELVNSQTPTNVRILGWDARTSGTITFDLGASPKSFVGTELIGGNTSSWNVEFSDDGNVWTRVAVLTATGTTRVDWEEQGAHRFWRYSMVYNNGTYWFNQYAWFVKE